MEVSKEIVSNDKKDEPLIFISDRAISLYNDNKILKARIDKAIEYIESKEEEEHINDYDEHYMDDYLDDYDEHLLDILKGSDNNVS